MSKKRPTPRREWQPLRQAGISNLNREQLANAGLRAPDAVYVNDRYSVFVRNLDGGALHISFHRHDRAAIRDWRHMQQIKNEVAGPERTAVEIYPPESQLVDTSNEYHLWVVPEGFPMPFVMAKRYVMTPDELTEELGPGTRARQRPWEKGLTTGTAAA